MFGFSDVDGVSPLLSPRTSFRLYLRVHILLPHVLAGASDWWCAFWKSLEGENCCAGRVQAVTEVVTDV
jgi:hypothetical protein